MNRPFIPQFKIRKNTRPKNIGRMPEARRGAGTAAGVPGGLWQEPSTKSNSVYLTHDTFVHGVSALTTSEGDNLSEKGREWKVCYKLVRRKTSTTRVMDLMGGK